MELQKLCNQVGRFALAYPYGQSEQPFLCIIQCFIQLHPLGTMQPVMYFLSRGESACYGGGYEIVPYEQVRHKLVGVRAVYPGFGCGQIVSQQYDEHSQQLMVQLCRLSDDKLAGFVPIEDIVIVCG
jgi:hypothetical protein